MALTLAKNQHQNDPTVAAVRVLLLDTPENLGIDFIQSLQKQGMKILFERVNDKEGLYSALKKRNWDILLVCDQVNVPGPEEALECLHQLECETGFVLLSKSAVSIAQLTSAYTKGIAAVVSSENPEYSVEVFTREVERSRRNFQLSLLNQEKFELKRHCQQLMSGTEEALAYLQDGIHVYGNDSYLKLLGYESMDDLMVMPFIDIISAEMRDKTKQQLLDYQHKVRLYPETPNLEVHELFVNGTGEREGVLQVGATFKPVVYDGENCLQVVFKINTASENSEEPGAAEGLGYPLFVAHLDSFIDRAHEASSELGHVAHIYATGLENYIAAKGFGNLNGKLKALASELKALLGKDDLQIRFTENSFLLLIKKHEAGVGSGQDPLAGIAAVLKRFGQILNKETGAEAASEGDGRNAGAINLYHDVVPVDANSVSAEQLIRNFLYDQTRSPVPEPNIAPATAAEAADRNVIHFNDFPRAAQPLVNNPADSARPLMAQSLREDPEGQASMRVNPGIDDGSRPVAEKGNPAVAEARKERAEQKITVAEPQAPSRPEEAATESTDEGSIGQQELTAGMAANELQLMYETVLSVTRIETELHDISVYMPETGNKPSQLISRQSLGEGLYSSGLAAKLDQWTLNRAIGVISDLYKQGQECVVTLSFTERSLLNKRLPDVIRKELSAKGLPGAMLYIGFSITDLNKDPAGSAGLLEKLKTVGIGLCITDIRDADELQEILLHTTVDMIRLDSMAIHRAAEDEDAFKALQQSVKKIQDKKMRVFVGGIHGNNELSICCKAAIDLVKGNYIQNDPLPFDADVLAEALMI